MTFADNKRESLGDRMRRRSFTAPGMPSPVSARPSETTVDAGEVAQVLAGDLRDKPIQWLLMAAQHYEATGRLQIGLDACPVVVQFGLGIPLHAQSPFCIGAEAIMDLFIWKDGKVKFEPGKQPDSVTVHESIEDLIERGERFADSQAFLDRYGINEMSFLVRPPARHAVGEVERRLKQGQELDPTMQMEFYSNIYGTRNIKDTAEKLSLMPSQWVSITANLLQLGILLTPDGRSIQTIPNREAAPGASTAEFDALRRADAEPPKPQPLTNLWQTKVSATTKESATIKESGLSARELPSEVTITPATMAKAGIHHIVTLDPSDHNRVLALLSSPDDGIYTFDAVQFFLTKEFARACRFKTMLTLVLFSIHCPGADKTIPSEVSVLVTATVSRIKRDVDVFGHFGSRAYALILPNVDSNQACLLVDRINNDLLEITPDLKRYNVTLHFGLASVPNDTSEINGLVKAAQVAMFNAASNNVLRTQAQHLR